ncbi:MAG: chemotaxis protein CheW [Bryobacter sp.]|jgi:purine-binding chemotaxis protein CheW|nr:chemotaxis protein CheW [Bryobacter sp. CoA8 C33]
MTQYCTFYLQDKHYGVPMLEVQEVIRGQSLTPVPLAQPMVEGLMNLRGSIVMCVDLRRRLGLADARENQAPLQIILNGQSGLVGWIVDRMSEVRELDPELGESPPGTILAENRELLDRVFALESGLLMVLNPERVFQGEPERTERHRESSRGFV